jgi:hypothetical protein
METQRQSGTRKIGTTPRLVVVAAGLCWIALSLLLSLALFAGMWELWQFVLVALWPVSSLAMGIVLIGRQARTRFFNASIGLAVLSTLGATYGLLRSNTAQTLILGILALSLGCAILGLLARTRRFA